MKKIKWADFSIMCYEDHKDFAGYDLSNKNVSCAVKLGIDLKGAKLDGAFYEDNRIIRDYLTNEILDKKW